MQRLAWFLVVMASACGDSGYKTGMAMLSTSTMVQSASAKPFTGADATGAMVLGWTVKFYPNKPGHDCMDDALAEVATLDIYTNQPDGSAKVATLETGGVAIVKDSPPSAASGFGAHMGIDDISNVAGLITIQDVYIDHITAMIAAGGTDSTGAQISVDGSFDALTCGSVK